MTLAHRRLLYMTFSMLFFVFAPLIVLYSLGFRVDLAHRGVYKVGLLVLTVQPDPERIRVDGKSTRVQGERNLIPNLRPGIHTVRIEKSGYLVWEQTVTIRPNQATSIGSIRLFRAGTQELLASGIRSISASPSGRYLALAEKERSSLSMLDTVNTTRRTLWEAPPRVVEEVVWAPAQDRLAARLNDGSWWLVTVGKQPFVTELTKIPAHTRKVLWSPDPDHLFFLAETTLFDLTISSGAFRLVGREMIDMTVAEGKLFVLRDTKDGAVVEQEEQDGTFRILTTLGGSDEALFLNAPDSALAILDPATASLAFLERNNGEPRPFSLFPQTAFAAWNAHENLLAFGNDFELSVFAPRAPFEERTTLLRRTGEALRQIVWIEGTSYLLLRQERSVQVVDAHPTSPHVFTTLLAQPVQDVVVNNDRHTLYALTTEGALLRQPLY